MLATTARAQNNTSTTSRNRRSRTPEYSTEQLVSLAREVRRDIITTIYKAGSGHPGGSLSELEILISLYFGAMRHDPTILAGPAGTG